MPKSRYPKFVPRYCGVDEHIATERPQPTKYMLFSYRNNMVHIVADSKDIAGNDALIVICDYLQDNIHLLNDPTLVVMAAWPAFGVQRSAISFPPLI